MSIMTDWKTRTKTMCPWHVFYYEKHFSPASDANFYTMRTMHTWHIIFLRLTIQNRSRFLVNHFTFYTCWCFDVMAFRWIEPHEFCHLLKAALFKTTNWTGAIWHVPLSNTPPPPHTHTHGLILPRTCHVVLFLSGISAISAFLIPLW